MTDLYSIAQLKSTAEFIAAVGDTDIGEYDKDGKSLLMAALGNTDLESRYATTQWLLDKGCKLGKANDEGYTELHILFAQVKHDIAKDVAIARQLIALGADINEVSWHGGLVFCEVVWMKYTDDDLKPLYDLWFEQPVKLDFETPSEQGRSPLSIARALPYRKDILERMEQYIAESKRG